MQLVLCGLWRSVYRVLVTQDSTDPKEVKIFRAHAAPQETCDNFFNSLKLLTIQQKDGDSPVENIVTGLLEKSRRGILDGLKKFFEVDNLEAVKVRGLQEGTES